ncbi:MAG: class I SAM-dependent methyltransferase [Chitinophagales bacterium]|nr:class I SAM-dependent methyltransferase [Chitinophagales bacterium]
MSYEPVSSFFNAPEKYLHRRYGIKIRQELCKKVLGNLEDKIILDAGCGDGSIGVEFLDKNKVVFCDVAEQMLKLTKNRIPRERRSSAVFFHGSVEEFNQESSFDFILCLGLLAHVTSLEKTVEGISKLLKPGGKVIFQFSDYSHWLTRCYVRLARHGYTINRIYYGDLLDLCIRHNLKLRQEIRYHFLLPGMGRLPDDLLYRFQKWVMRKSYLSFLCTDYLWVLQK